MLLSLKHFNGSVPEEPLNAPRVKDAPGTRHAAVLFVYARHSGLVSCCRGHADVASTAACDNVGDMGAG